MAKKVKNELRSGMGSKGLLGRSNTCKNLRQLLTITLNNYATCTHKKVKHSLENLLQINDPRLELSQPKTNREATESWEIDAFSRKAGKAKKKREQFFFYK